MPTAREVHDFLQSDSGVSVTNLYTGDCRGCGECCSRFLPLSEHDIQAIRDYVASHGIEQVLERSDIDLFCPYLTEERECLIYEARPDICRAYRCDMHASGKLTPIATLVCRHHPYINQDMREVVT